MNFKATHATRTARDDLTSHPYMAVPTELFPCNLTMVAAVELAAWGQSSPAATSLSSLLSPVMTNPRLDVGEGQSCHYEKLLAEKKRKQ
jgi:hypothetical protein